MTRKSNNGNKPKMPKQKQQPPKKKPTPFANAGKAVGRLASAYTGIPGLGTLGSLFGSRIGSIFGSGDYIISGTPKVNVLSGSPPQFSSTQATNVVCHREYIMDITGTTAFTNTVLPLNPGDNQTFPWLSTIAASYSQYRFHGVVFEFKPLITDFVVGGAPGVLVMSTNYNADDPAFTSKRQAENSEFAVAIKPTEPLMHLIECDPKQTSINELYVRVGNNPTGVDKKTTDLGNFQIATQGNPVQLLGELWVTYCVEFFKPELPIVGLSFTSHITRFTFSSVTVNFGTTLTSAQGSINSTSAAGAVSYFGLSPLTNYLFTCVIVTDFALTAVPVFAVGPGTIVNAFTNTTGNANVNTSPNGGGIGSTTYVVDRVYKSDVTGTITVNTTLGVQAPAGGVGVDIYLSSIQQNVN